MISSWILSQPRSDRIQGDRWYVWGDVRGMVATRYGKARRQGILMCVWETNISVAKDGRVYEGQCEELRLLGRLESISGKFKCQTKETGQ